MGQDNLERHIRQSLINHETALDTDALWSSIEGVQSKSRLKRYLIAALLFLFSTAAIAYVAYNLSLDKTIADSGKVSNYQSNTSLEKSSSQNIKSNDQATNNKLLITPDTEVTVADNNKNLNAIESKGVFGNTSVANETAQSENNNAPTAQNDVLKSAEPVNLSNNRSLLNNNLSAGQLISKQSHTLLDNKNENSQLDIQKLESLRPMDLDRQLAESLPFIKKTECPTFGKKKNRIFAELYSSVDYVINNYDAAIEVQEYLGQRESTQSYQPSYRAGAQFKYLFDNGLYFKMGLEYAAARERFRHRTETITTEILPNQVIGIFVDMNGDTTITLGNAPVTTIETRNWRVKNSYRSIGIPINIGYQFDRGPWFYGLDAGIIYNLQFDFRGMLLSPSGEPVEADNYFKNNIGISFNTCLTAGYRSQENWSVLFKLNARTQSANINTDMNPVNQRYTMVGTGIGLEYEF
jgi:hypothetical protein